MEVINVDIDDVDHHYNNTEDENRNHSRPSEYVNRLSVPKFFQLKVSYVSYVESDSVFVKVTF
jgi:hypothetical protein